jgi:hypothetical protein
VIRHGGPASGELDQCAHLTAHDVAEIDNEIRAALSEIGHA